MPLTMGAQLRACRALLRLEKAELAKLAGVSPATLRKMESVDGPFDTRTATARALEAVFAARGVSFYDEGEPGARLKLAEAAA